MTSKVEESDLSYEQLKEKCDFFEKKYLQLKKEHEALLASCRKEASDDIEPPAKIQRLIPSTDPFVALDPELVDIILTYLTPKELLTAMEVSKTWKIFIESRKSRMKRIMDNIVVKLESEKFEEVKNKAVEVILAGGRRYKHMKADFGIELAASVFPFINSASTLESLEIAWKNMPFNDIPPAVNFTKLTKLIVLCEDFSYSFDSYQSCLMNFIKASSFPEVTHLKIFEFDGRVTSFNQLIEKFPKLKVLSSAWNENDVGWEYDAPYVKFESQPKIEAMCVYEFYPNLFLGFAGTLTEVSLGNIIADDLPHLLESLPRLQSLSINLIQEGPLNEEEFLHENLKKLSIRRMLYFSMESEGFHQLLRALPALQSLSLEESSEGLIEFLASNMKNLKKFICSRLFDEAEEFYATLKENEHQYVNTSFEIAQETIQNAVFMFNNTHFK